MGQLAQLTGEQNPTGLGMELEQQDHDFRLSPLANLLRHAHMFSQDNAAEYALFDDILGNMEAFQLLLTKSTVHC